MGRIVRRFARFFEQELLGNFEQGLWAAGLGIAQYEADQVLHSSVICTTALGGTVVASWSGVHVNVDMTGDVRGHIVRAVVDDNVELTGSLWGQQIEVSILGATAWSTGTVEGLRIEMALEAGCDVTGGGVYGIHLSSTFDTDPAFAYRFMRFSEHGVAGIRAGLMFYITGTASMDYVLELHSGAAIPAWDIVAMPPGAAQGRLAIIVNGFNKYIQLYN